MPAIPTVPFKKLPLKAIRYLTYIMELDRVA